MVITLTGDNTFEAAQAERQLVQAFTVKHSANGIERIDAETLSADRLPDLLQGATLFAPVRLVILKNLSNNKTLHEPLTEALAKASPETTVVIADAQLDKRTKLYKFLKASSNFQDFPAPDTQKLTEWVQKVAQNAGAEVSKTMALYLIQRIGFDQWRLHNEIQKLAVHPVITQELIDDLVESSPEASAFELLDAALAGKKTQVATAINTLKTTEDPYKLFGLLASQAHALAVVSVAGVRSPDVIAKDAGLHPFVVRKTQTVANRLGAQHVRRIVQDVADCDWRLKSSGVDPWYLIETTLLKMSV